MRPVQPLNAFTPIVVRLLLSAYARVCPPTNNTFVKLMLFSNALLPIDVAVAGIIAVPAAWPASVQPVTSVPVICTVSAPHCA